MTRSDISAGRARRPLASHRDLIAWQQAMDLAVACCETARTLPPAERFGLASQLRRAAVSVPANLAEGYGRIHRAEYVHHVSIARGSLKELETLVLLAGRLGEISSDDARRLELQSARVGQLVTRLLAALQRTVPSASRRPTPDSRRPPPTTR